MRVIQMKIVNMDQLFEATGMTTEDLLAFAEMFAPHVSLRPVPVNEISCDYLPDSRNPSCKLRSWGTRSMLVYIHVATNPRRDDSRGLCNGAVNTGSSRSTVVAT